MKDLVIKIVQLVLAAVGGGLTTQGIATESEVTAIVGGVVGIIGAVWAIWERRKAVADAAAKTVPLLLIGLLSVSMVLPLTGCHLTAAEKEAVASTLLSVAKAGVSVGLQALSAKVPALAAVVPLLQARLDVTFAEATAATTPAELAAQIREDVLLSVAEPEAQQQIIDALVAALGAETTPSTAAGPDDAAAREFAAQLRTALANQ